MLLDTQASLQGGAAVGRGHSPRAPWAGVWMEMGQEAVSVATASAQDPAGGLGSGPACWNARPPGALGSDAASRWTGPGDLAGSVTSSEPGAVGSGQCPCPFARWGCGSQGHILPWPGLGGAAWTQVLGQDWWQGGAISPQRAQALQVKLILPTRTPRAGSAQCRPGGVWNKDV